MGLSTGTRLGAYEILSAIGAGGMGEVYRARDTKLNRDVAIKVLPDLFALDPDRLARFTREAQVLASLNHPNIAAIYGIEGNALVMELVEGEDLAQRLSRGAIPLDEVLPIAKQIADALEAAHEQGIVHRDLKPANIKVRPDGTVKVLDFGLAKAMSPDGSATADAMQSPTLTAKATALGVIIGTAAYMSPEQARGRAIDRRTDVWAFGCVLYEMLTGRRAFDGDDATEIIAAVVKTEPDLTVLAAMPPHLQSVVARCLVKERKARVPDLSVVRYMLDEPAAAVASPPAAAPAPARASVLPWAIASIGLVAAGVMLWQSAPWRAAPAPAPIRFEIAAAATGFDPVPAIYRNIALSPDGTKIVYGTGTGLMIRSLDQMEPAVLRANARQGGSFLPFFSPDGRWVGFFDLDGMKKVLVTGGPAVQITNTIGPRGASWGPGDTIYFANSDLNSGILSVSANGGEVKTLTKAENGNLALDHIYPSVLPGGRGILYTVLTASLLVDNMQIAVLDLATGTSKVLINGGTQAEYVEGPGGAGGYLVYAAAGTLRAVPFNLKTLEVVGDGVPVVDGVAMTTTGPAHFGVSKGGTLVYASGALTSTAASRSLVWIDRNGHEEPIARAPRRSYFALRLSPDGTRLALDIRDENSDIWVWHLTNETLTRLTFPVGTEGLPIWSPDSSRIVYYSAAEANNLFWQPADGTGSPERLTKVSHAQAPLDFSRDGKQMLIRERPGATGDDVSVMSMDTRAVTPLFHAPVNENNAQISPDGRWVAYESAETTPTQVYVRPFPDVNSGRWQVSSSGGLRPMWGPDGKELFFAGNDGLMVVPVDTTGHFSFGAARRLFDVRITAGLVSGRSWDITPDGRRFIVIKDVPPDPSIPVKPQAIAVVINWVSDLQTRLKR